jgi:hypothetical protein
MSASKLNQTVRTNMADSERPQLESLKKFAEQEIKMAGQAIREFDGDTFSEWCVERGLFTERAIGGYLRAMKLMAEQIGASLASPELMTPTK